MSLSVLVRNHGRWPVRFAGCDRPVPVEVQHLVMGEWKQAVGDGQATLAYLARYVFKVAISESRILTIDQEAVTFRYRKVHSNRLRTLRLPIPEFMRRFLQHVLPSGLMKVRYFGFLSPSCAVPLEELKARIEMAHGFAQQPAPIDFEPPAPMRCPHCGGSLRFVRAIAPPKLHRSLATAILGASYSGP